MPDETPATPEKIHKALVNFIQETRDNFSTNMEEGESDFKFLQTMNENILKLISKVEGLTAAVDRLNTTLHNDNKEVKKTIVNKTEEIREEVAPKKVIVKHIPHFSLKLWWQTLWKRG